MIDLMEGEEENEDEESFLPEEKKNEPVLVLTSLFSFHEVKYLYCCDFIREYLVEEE